MFPKIAIIILNYNRLKDTIECLESCFKINYPNFEIILIDNGSKPNQRPNESQVVNKNCVQIIQLEKNLGFAEGNNLGIRQALKNKDVKYIICLNNDAIVELNFVSEMVKTAQNGLDMVNAKVMRYDDRNQIDNLGMEVTASMLTFNRKNSERKLFCPTGCAALYSRELLEQVKLGDDYFDADYFCYAEDFDLGFRALLKGFRPAVADQAIVYHKGSVTGGPMGDFAVYYSYRNILYTMIKNLPTGLFFRFLPKIKLGHWAIILLYLKRKRFALISKAYFHAFSDSRKFLIKRKIIQKHKKISNRDLLKYIEKRIFSKDYLSVKDEIDR